MKSDFAKLASIRYPSDAARKDQIAAFFNFHSARLNLNSAFIAPAVDRGKRNENEGLSAFESSLCSMIMRRGQPI